MRLSELRRILSPRATLTLRFQQRECVIVPQMRGIVGLHADVHLAASAPRSVVLDDAFLLWRTGRSEFRRSRWDRAVIDGKFRYPPQPLSVEVRREPVTLTLTFTDPLIPHADQPAPASSSLVLEIRTAGGRSQQRELWRVEMTSWEEPARVEWVGDS